VSFEDDKLLGNLGAMMEAINAAKPSGARGQYIRSVTVAPTMGPGIRVDVTAANALRAA
jgi:large subunit ribosomal protein L1